MKFYLVMFYCDDKTFDFFARNQQHKIDTSASICLTLNHSYLHIWNNEPSQSIDEQFQIKIDKSVSDSQWIILSNQNT